MKPQAPTQHSSNPTIHSPPRPTTLDALLNRPNPTDRALVPRTEPATTPPPATQTPHPSSAVAIHPSIHSSNNPLPALPARKPRNGKIARLPKPVREVVNRMLFHNMSQQRIVDALAEMGFTVTQCNISNWKTHGGYREWCLAQEHAIQLRLHQDNLLDLLRRHDATELPEVGLQAAATQLSQFFLMPEARQLLASDPKEYERRVSMLARISAQLKPLQKYRDDCAKALGADHDPDRIRRETNASLNRVTEAYTSQIPDSPKEPEVPHRNLLPSPSELFNFSDRPPVPEPPNPTLTEMLAWLDLVRKPASKPAA